MKLLLSIIFFTIATITIKAQDYLISVKGDSILCKISFPLIGSRKYKTDTSGSKKIKLQNTSLNIIADDEKQA